MDLSVLPEVLALIALVGLLQPLTARIGRQGTPWVLGWTMLLVHYVARMVGGSTGLRQTACDLIAMAAVQVSACFFLRAAGNPLDQRIDRTFSLQLLFALTCQGLFAMLGVTGLPFQRAAAVLLVLPALHLAIDSRRSSNLMLGVAAPFAVAGCLLVFLPSIGAQLDPQMVTSSLLTLLYLSIAWVYLAVRPLNRSSILATLALALWGFTYPIVAALVHLDPSLPLDRHLVRLPQYLTAMAVTMNLMQELVARTEHMAMHDPLTGLANRRAFERRLELAMAQAKAAKNPLAFLVIDVDNFKTINDSLGHPAGDELLRALAVRLSWHIGPADILARTGGDEFTAVLAGVGDEHHLRFVARAMMSAASVPFSIGSESVECHISIGIAVASQNAQDMAALRSAADQAMYRAKRIGGGVLAFAEDHPAAHPMAQHLERSPQVAVGR